MWSHCGRRMDALLPTRQNGAICHHGTDVCSHCGRRMHFCQPVKMGQSFITAQWKIYCVSGADRPVFAYGKFVVFLARIGKFLPMGVIKVLPFFSIAEVMATMHPNVVVACGGASIGVVVMWSWLHAVRATIFVRMSHAVCRVRTVIPLFRTEFEPSGQQML